MMEVVIASANAGKLREFTTLLAPLPFTVNSQAHYGIEPAPETGSTFVENATSPDATSTTTTS